MSAPFAKIKCADLGVDIVRWQLYISVLSRLALVALVGFLPCPDDAAVLASASDKLLHTLLTGPVDEPAFFFA
jgi:hypothetical protein